MKIFEELRPVEALFLMSFIDKEEWSTENALAAVLVYLAVNKYIKADGSEFILTAKGELAIREEASLRGYEIDILNAIDDGDIEDIVEIIDWFDFEKLFMGFGIFTKQPAKFLRFIPYKKTVLASKTDDAIKQLLSARNAISGSIYQGKKVEGNYITFVYAFPSLALSNGFREYANKLVDAAEATDVAMAATMSAVMVATICTNIITTNTIITSS